MRSILWLVVGLSASTASIGCAPVPGTPGGVGGDYSGAYCGTATTVTPGGATSGAVTFSCSGGSCADPGNTFTGTVSTSGFFTGSTRVCGACAAFPMSGQMSTSSSFTISGSSGGGSSQTVTASYCGGPSGGGGGGGGDTTPPSRPGGLTATPTGTDVIVLTWDEPADAADVARYEVRRGGAAIGTVTSGFSTSDSGLAMATRYCYSLVAYDAAGNRSAESDLACATTLCETTAPSTPEQVSAFGRTESEIRIAWARSTDAGGGRVAGYRLYRDAELAADVPASSAYDPSAIDAGRAPLARHCYEVEAYDGCGNASPRSAPACAATIAILVPDAPAPERIALDATRVYWTDGGTSKLMSVSRSDGTVAELAARLQGNALETDGTSVFYVGWNDAGAAELRAVPAAGGPPVTLAAGVGAFDLAVDATTVYAAGGALVRVPIGGGPAWSVPAAPHRLALDGTHVYWTEYEWGAVKMAPLGGTEVTTIASGRYGPYAIAVDATHVYWTEDGSGGGSASVRKRRKDLAEPMTTLVTRPNAGPYSIAVDATGVYWGEYGGGVFAVGLDGGSFRKLVERTNGPSDLAMDETGIYWVERYAHVVAKALK